MVQGHIDGRIQISAACADEDRTCGEAALRRNILFHLMEGDAQSQPVMKLIEREGPSTFLLHANDQKLRSADGFDDNQAGIDRRVPSTALDFEMSSERLRFPAVIVVSADTMNHQLAEVGSQIEIQTTDAGDFTDEIR